MLTTAGPPAANAPGPLSITTSAHDSMFVVIASSRNSEQQIMMSGTDERSGVKQAFFCRILIAR